MQLKIDPEFKSLIPPLENGIAYTGYATRNGEVWFIRLFPHTKPGYHFVEVSGLPLGSAAYSKVALKDEYIYLFVSQSGAPCIEYEWKSFPKESTRENPFSEKDRIKKRARKTVYFLLAEKTKVIKIGISDNVKARAEAIQSMSPDRLILIGTEPGDEKRESELHEKFSRFRSHGEWFHASDELISYIKENTNDHIDYFS
jgi:hypothetical protein